jgi:preprotein translocase subunit SecA
MAKGLLKHLFGDSNQRKIVQLQKTAQLITSLEPEIKQLSDQELREKTQLFRERLESGESLEDLLPEAFAVVREASRRTIGLRHYDVQLIGGMILHDGQVAEMRTGEGKTLVATLPLYLNALAGHGAHLVTPNDYLAKYGVQWMGPVYHALGISASVIQSGAGRPDEASFLYDPDYTSSDDRYQYLRPITRREAYNADVTYGTNNEFGFDYLRDNMVIDISQCTQREMHYAIVDEVDSILIDEARTPLIISGPAEESSELYHKFARLVEALLPDRDYEVDPRSQIAILTDEGANRVESLAAIPEEKSIYDPEYAHMLPYLDNALRAKEFYHLDKEYVVRDGEIIIVDEFTGRLMFGRRYSEGLHQAIEAKQGVNVRRESLTYATITFQNFFRMYNKLSGMTGTAETEKEELHRIYNLDVIVLPTNVEYRARFGNLEEREVAPSDSGVAFGGVLPENSNYKVTIYENDGSERYYQRLDMPDQIYKTEQAKFNAVVDEISQAHQAGRPVLVGTTAIETSERLSKLLKRHRIPHNVLNAKYHEREATIIAQAGSSGAVTIATNMAGRGVDILLGGNPEGLAREELRNENVDLTLIHSADWEKVLRMARAGEHPASAFPDAQWVEELYAEVQACQIDRERVYNQGGLHVIGTERHEARRIDNQLRGRAGRQGDPGSSRFFISLKDELMRRFGGERLQPWMERAGLDDAPLEFNMLAKVIESVQERVEGYNFDVRKHVLEYDNVVNKQREVIYAERRKILSRDDLHDDLMDMVAGEIRGVVESHLAVDDEEQDFDALLAELRRFIPFPRSTTSTEMRELSTDALVEKFLAWADDAYFKINQQRGLILFNAIRQEERTLRSLLETPDAFHRNISEQIHKQIDAQTLEKYTDLPIRRLYDDVSEILKNVIIDVGRLFQDRRLMLRQIDNHWIQHLTSLDMLREGIGLRAIGQQNPLVAYQKEAFEAFQDMLASIQTEIVRSLFTVTPTMQTSTQRRVSPSRTPLTFRAGGAGGEAAEATPQPHKSTRKVGRNDPCWCGSGKKYKSCHMREDLAKSRVPTR